MDMSNGFAQLRHVAGDGDVATACDGVLRDYLVANYARLHRRLLRHLGCADAASDCLHDAWLRLGEAQPSASVQNPEAYIYRVACNIAIDHLRSHRLRYRESGDEAGADIDQIADAAPGPEMVAEARSSLACVVRSLQCLPHLHQAIVVALRVDESPRQEVASRYGLSLRNVDTMLRKSLERCVHSAL